MIKSCCHLQISCPAARADPDNNDSVLRVLEKSLVGWWEINVQR